MKSLVSAKPRALLALFVLGAALLLAAPGAPSSGPQHGFLERTAAQTASSVVPSGFSDQVAFSGLTNPTSVRFSPDGRIFVAEKGGLVKVFDGPNDTTPTVAVELRDQVDDFWDRGLLGLALDPSFPTNPYVYLLYTYDALPGQSSPKWNDACPTPPGPTTDGCVVTGKLVRVHLSGDTADQPPQGLISGQWCQQYPSHSVGDLQFGADGMLYVSAGDGASFNWVDYGQGGGSAGSPTPKNPCADPPAGSGGNETPPTAQGGALRSQSAGRANGPGLLNGSLLRVDPTTGGAAAGNPWIANPDANLKRVIAYGMRNPFRFVFRPGTSQIWIGDVGWADWEEIDRRPTPTGTVQNFGWPCYEGTGIQPGYQSAGLNICSALYGTPGSVTAPYYTYSHAAQVALGDNCPTANGSVVSGLAFYGSGGYPASYDGALVFADHSRNCIWTMSLGTNGDPDPTKLQALVEGAANPVDIETGPNGDLYYVDFDGGTIHHIAYSPVPGCSSNTFRAEYFNNVTLSGQPVLTRCEDAIDHDWGTGSPAPEVNADSFSASWTRDVDLTPGTYTFTATTDDGIRINVDGNALIDQWHEQAPTTYTVHGVHIADGTHHLRVEYYEDGNTAVAQVGWQLDEADAPPTPVIDTPSSSLTYAIGDPIAFMGHATDAEDGALPASSLSWTLLVHHCTTAGCHVHNIESWPGTTGGSFSAPDHEYPSHLELVLHATDSLGVPSSTSVLLNPQTVALSFRTQPVGLQLAVGSSSKSAPFVNTVIVNSQSSLSAPVTQTVGGRVFHFVSWSDGGAAAHNITAPASPRTYTATYREELPPPPSATAAPTLTGIAQQGKTLRATAGTWTGATGLAYSWLRCNPNGAGCVRIGGAAGSSYTLTGFDVGSRIAAQVTGTNAGGSSSARSSASAVVKRFARVVSRVAPRRDVRSRPHFGH